MRAVSVRRRTVPGMASTTCGNCGRLAHMEPVSGLHIIAPPFGRGGRHEAAFKCPNCLRLNLAFEVPLSRVRMISCAAALQISGARGSGLPLLEGLGEVNAVSAAT